MDVPAIGTRCFVLLLFLLLVPHTDAYADRRLIPPYKVVGVRPLQLRQCMHGRAKPRIECNMCLNMTPMFQLQGLRTSSWEAGVAQPIKQP
eukprot:1868412-Amphidinium_carterae.1